MDRARRHADAVRAPEHARGTCHASPTARTTDSIPCFGASFREIRQLGDQPRGRVERQSAITE